MGGPAADWLGAVFILRKGKGGVGGSRKWQFSLTLCNENKGPRGEGGSEKGQKTPYVI